MRMRMMRRRKSECAKQLPDQHTLHGNDEEEENGEDDNDDEEKEEDGGEDDDEEEVRMCQVTG